MDMRIDQIEAMPVVRDLVKFDQNSGNALERMVFSHRLLFILACTIITLVLGYLGASKLALIASFEKMMPQSKPYIQKYLANKTALRGLSMVVGVVVESPPGVNFDAQYLQLLK